MPRPKPVRKSRTLGQRLGFFLLLNLIPIGVSAYLLIRYWRGEIAFTGLPPGFTTNAAVAFGALVLLVLVASLSLPAAHGAVKGIEATWRGALLVLGGKAPGNRFLALLALPPLAVAWMLAWPVRAVLILASFALIAVVVVFVIRLAKPEFLQEWVDRALSWRP